MDARTYTDKVANQCFIFTNPPEDKKKKKNILVEALDLAEVGNNICFGGKGSAVFPSYCGMDHHGASYGAVTQDGQIGITSIARTYMLQDQVGVVILLIRGNI